MNPESDHESIDFHLPDTDAEINERLKSDPEFRKDFAEHWLLVAALDEVMADQQNLNQSTGHRPEREVPGKQEWLFRYGGWLVAATVILGFFLWNFIQPDDLAPRSEVAFTHLAQASFFGELTPGIGASPDLNRDYSLVSGSAKLAFPDGATAIIEGPAVFRVVSDDRLALDVGRCSVHAPDGAEGFRVDTPNSRVIDRGTRFFVNVSESSETEVQVVEGAADIHPEGTQDPEMFHLTDGNARMIRHGDSAPLPFAPEGYRNGLPDRVVSYEAAPGQDGRAKTLTSLTVQRGGREISYSAEKLIPIRLTSFRVGPVPHKIGHLVSEAHLPERRAALAEDFDLNTGLINPGGSEHPLTGPFDPEQTPGFAVHFREPVLNGPGPDVVFFEIQNAVKVPQGDAFHVSPLSWESGLKSHTIWQYDLMLTSRAALPVSDRYLFLTTDPILSLEDIETVNATSSASKLRFSAVAVGIDLSDLGYEPDAPVEGLFFQDAMNDDDHVDPMVIVGLPN